MKTTALILIAAAALAVGCRSARVAARTAPAADCTPTSGQKPSPHPRKQIVFKGSGSDCTVTAEHVVVANGGSIGWTVRNQCAAPVTLSLDDKGHGPLQHCQKQELTVAAGAEDTIACTLDKKWAQKADFCSAYGVEWELGSGSSQYLDPILDIRKTDGP